LLEVFKRLVRLFGDVFRRGFGSLIDANLTGNEVKIASLA
jgi:hypothetical protein